MIPSRILKRTTIEQLRKAIALKVKLDRAETLERHRAKLLKAVARLDRKLARLNGGNRSEKTAAKPSRKGFKLSAVTRRKMSLAAKRRYAGKGKAASPAPGKKRRTLSAEGRAAISAAQKSRWAKLKRETQPSVGGA